MGALNQAERILNENPGKPYCVKCLGEAAGARTMDEQEVVARLFHQSASYTDRKRNWGKCSVCGCERQVICKL